MSKKKNTLKDLDEFLKQQAANLVSPEKLSDKLGERVQEKPTVKKTEQVDSEIVAQVKQLIQKNGHSTLYDIIIQSLESDNEPSPEDMMLINTALYLKSGDSWQSEIRAFWRNKAKS